jgi:PAS domain S-box-containing protein
MGDLKILILEDNALDAELIKEELIAHRFQFISKLVDTKADFTNALKNFKPDIILSDYSLPQFTGFEALEIAIEQAPTIPFILVTGHLTEEIAVDAIKNGAWDYVLKTNLIRLMPAIENTIKLREEKETNLRINKDLKKLITAVEQSPNSIVITDVDGNIEYTNAKFTKISGYTAEEVLGKNPNILSSGIQSKAYYTKMWKTITAGKIWNGKFCNKAKNGSLFWEEATISPIKDADGAITTYFGIKQDITELVKSENDLLEIYSAISSSPIVVFLWGTKKAWKADFVSSNVVELLGYSPEEFLSGKISFKNLIHPDDFHKITEEGIKHHKEGKKHKLIQEYRVFTKEGVIKWVRDFPAIRKDSNQIITHYQGVMHDITEIKQNEQNLLEAQRISKIGSFDLNLKTHIIKGSITLKSIFGFDRNTEITLDLFRSVVHPEDISNNIKTLDNVIKTGKKVDITYRVLTNGTQELKWVHGLGEVNYINGEAINYFGTVQDITLEKTAELELLRLYDEVAQLKIQLETENVHLKEEIALSFNYENLVYASEEISNVLTQVEQVANTNATVLILGETGTGKELIAKALHNTSNRKDKALIRVNCAAIPAELLESELFGHRKGSFTGAHKDRIGKFQLANGGTLFLDEIGEMPLELQPKLLRAIQEGEIEPIGSSKIIKLDLRIIAATNRELEKEVKNKRFRQDLFFRLNVFPITIPPLRNRIEDITVLVDYFLDKFCLKYQKNITSISKEALQQMKIYPWPGNVRELENIVERAVITSNKDSITFPEFESKRISQANLEKKKYSAMSLDDIQSNYIIKTLNQTNWKIEGKEGAASLMDIKPSTLRDRMAKFGIKKSKV